MRMLKVTAKRGLDLAYRWFCGLGIEDKTGVIRRSRVRATNGFATTGFSVVCLSGSLTPEVKEYLATLNDETFGAATDVTPAIPAFAELVPLSERGAISEPGKTGGRQRPRRCRPHCHTEPPYSGGIFFEGVADAPLNQENPARSEHPSPDFPASLVCSLTQDCLCFHAF